MVKKVVKNIRLSKRDVLCRMTVNHSSGCWEWNGALMPKGYGRIKLDHITMLAHRYSNGERRWNSKLSDDEVETIRFIHAAGLATQKELAYAFSVGSPQICRVVNNHQRTRATSSTTGG